MVTLVTTDSSHFPLYHGKEKVGEIDNTSLGPLGLRV